MNCSAARDRMLEADLAELTGTPESDLSLHLRGCASCRESAARIVAAELDLSRALRSAAPRQEVEQAIRRPRAPRHRWGWRAMPLAAAAAIVGVILLSHYGHPPQTPTSRPVVTTPPLEIEVPPGQTAAVMVTGDPDIIVIWFY